MSLVTFLAPRESHGMEAVRMRVELDEEVTLIDLMERQNLPSRCHCRGGACGQCAVKVALLSEAGQRAAVYLGNRERETLFAHGKLTRRQYELPFMTYSEPLWRLACQCQVGEHDIVVAL